MNVARLQRDHRKLMIDLYTQRTLDLYRKLSPNVGLLGDIEDVILDIRDELLLENEQTKLKVVK